MVLQKVLGELRGRSKQIQYLEKLLQEQKELRRANSNMAAKLIVAGETTGDKFEDFGIILGDYDQEFTEALRTFSGAFEKKSGELFVCAEKKKQVYSHENFVSKTLYAGYCRFGLIFNYDNPWVLHIDTPQLVMQNGNKDWRKRDENLLILTPELFESYSPLRTLVQKKEANLKDPVWGFNIGNDAVKHFFFKNRLGKVYQEIYERDPENFKNTYNDIYTMITEFAEEKYQLLQNILK